MSLEVSFRDGSTGFIESGKNLFGFKGFGISRPTYFVGESEFSFENTDAAHIVSKILEGSVFNVFLDFFLYEGESFADYCDESLNGAVVASGRESKRHCSVQMIEVDPKGRIFMIKIVFGHKLFGTNLYHDNFVTLPAVFDRLELIERRAIVDSTPLQARKIKAQSI